MRPRTRSKYVNWTRSNIITLCAQVLLAKLSQFEVIYRNFYVPLYKLWLEMRLISYSAGKYWEEFEYLHKNLTSVCVCVYRNFCWIFTRKFHDLWLSSRRLTFFRKWQLKYLQAASKERETLTENFNSVVVGWVFIFRLKNKLSLFFVRLELEWNVAWLWPSSATKLAFVWYDCTHHDFRIEAQVEVDRKIITPALFASN